nr:reverse transcriptase domain-containing protein [Tanacetum cinerariifolium]
MIIDLFDLYSFELTVVEMVLWERNVCWWRLKKSRVEVAETRAKLKESRTPLVGFSGEGRKSRADKKEGEPEDTIQPPPNPPEKDTQTDEKIKGKDEHPERPVESKLPEKVNHVDAFAWTPADMTGIPCVIAEHELKTYPHIEPRVKRKQSIAPDRRKVVKEDVVEWLKVRIVRKVRYPTWVANPVLDKKLDGSWRMCVNFKDLNKAYPKDLYPIPEIDWKIESLLGFKYKFFLDAYKGYHQIQMKKKDEEKTTFHTNGGVLCNTKMPFGLKNAGAIYQRLVDTIFEGQMGRNLKAYVDDMVIKSKAELEMIKDVEETLLTLKKVNMKLNPKKCSFRMEEGKFLGYIVTSEGIRSNLEKAKAEEELMVYLLAANEAFNSVLLVERHGRQAPIHYISRTLQGAKINYPPMKKLVLALVHAARRLKRYFQGHASKVITDKPISQVLNSQDATGRLAKCGIELEAYGIKYASRSVIKGQVLTDFLADTMAEDSSAQIKATGPNDALAEGKSREEQEAPKAKTYKNLGTEADIWKLYTDKASNEHGSVAGLILIDPEGA